jgi:hypothetical protein
MIQKKRIKDGLIIVMSNWDLLPISQQKKFNELDIIEIPNSIQSRLEPKPITRRKKILK